MQDYYTFFLIIHLFCAIVFVGYLFFDVVILGLARKKIQNFQDFKSKIGDITTKIMPFMVLMLFISGGIMSSKYLASPIETTFQFLLLVKIILATCILSLVCFSLTCYFILKRPNPLGKYVHPIVFTICIFIVLLAKLMFLF